jgi:outer membrane protein
MMSRISRLVSIAVLAALPLSGALGADLSGSPSGDSYKDGPSNYWVVTIGGYGGAEPEFPGAKDFTFSFRPIIDIRRAGEPEDLNLPNDAVSVTLYKSGPFRLGVAGDLINSRDHSDADSLHGLRDIDYTVELGGFAEYWLAPNLRTRVELLQGVTGADGFTANFSADYVYKPDARWLFTFGPRMQAVNTQYESTFFSVNTAESFATGLVPYHASGGIHSAGIDATVRYNVSDRFSIRAFADWERLLGDAADSPIVQVRGSEDQFEFGVGAAYTFDVHRSDLGAAGTLLGR